MNLDVVFISVDFIRTYILVIFRLCSKMADSSCFFTQLCVLAVFVSSLFDVGYSLDLSCVEVKKEYVNTLGFRDTNIPISPINGKISELCFSRVLELLFIECGCFHLNIVILN